MLKEKHENGEQDRENVIWYELMLKVLPLMNIQMLQVIK